LQLTSSLPESRTCMSAAGLLQVSHLHQGRKSGTYSRLAVASPAMTEQSLRPTLAPVGEIGADYSGQASNCNLTLPANCRRI
jgi:hypothetical protein